MVKEKEFDFYWEKQSKNFPKEIEDTDTEDDDEISINNEISVNISETDNEVIIKAELPYISGEDITLNVTEDSIEIGVERENKNIVHDDGVHKEEISMISSHKFFNLPSRVKKDSTTTEIKNGLLIVKMKKEDPA